MLQNVVGAATINADGDESRGRVMLLLVKCEEAGEDVYRWYGTDDGREWHDAEVSAHTRKQAEEAAAMAWSGDEWGLEWPWEHGER